MISGLLILACLVAGKHTVPTAHSSFRLRAPSFPCYHSGMRDLHNSPSLALLGQKHLHCLPHMCVSLSGTLP
jgi:hypothetical protein